MYSLLLALPLFANPSPVTVIAESPESIEQVYQDARAYRDMRCRAVVKLHRNGAPVTDIAEQLNMTRPTVRTIIHGYEG